MRIYSTTQDPNTNTLTPYLQLKILCDDQRSFDLETHITHHDPNTNTLTLSPPPANSLPVKSGPWNHPGPKHKHPNPRAPSGNTKEWMFFRNYALCDTQTSQDLDIHLTSQDQNTNTVSVWTVYTSCHVQSGCHWKEMETLYRPPLQFEWWKKPTALSAAKASEHVWNGWKLKHIATYESTQQPRTQTQTPLPCIPSWKY